MGRSAETCLVDEVVVCGLELCLGRLPNVAATCLGDVSPVLRRPAFVSPRVASVRLHLLSPCRLVRSKHIQKKMLRSTAPCYVHTKLLMIRQTRTTNGLSLCSCLLKEQVQERLNSPDLQSNVVLRNLRCMATHVSGGVYIYISNWTKYCTVAKSVGRGWPI